VLSIDVGICNLACCKAAVGPCGGIVEILEWTVLNLTRSGDTTTAAEAVTCVQCAGRKRPFQAAFVHSALPPLCGPHARKIEGMFFPVPVVSAAARKRKRRIDAEAQAAAFLDDGVAEEEEEEVVAPAPAAAAALPPPTVDATETAVVESYAVTKSALTSMSLPELRQFAARHRGFAGGGWTAPPATASKTQVVARMIEHMTSHTWQRSGDAAEAAISGSKLSVVDAGMRFAVEAQRLQLFTGVHELIVENQIGLIASRMKSMQDVVMCMAVFAGVPKVRAVSAATKLNHLGVINKKNSEPLQDRPDGEGGGTNQRSIYVAHKKDGIAACRAYMAANPIVFRNWAAVFERAKKKDDFADSLLQLLGQIQ